MSELESVRAELKEVRLLTEAVLAALVGEDKIESRLLFASIDARRRRERAGTPLRSFRLPGDAGRAFYRMDIVTLEDLAQYPRSEIAAIEGVGRKTMQQLDLALAEHELTWRERINDESRPRS